MTVPLGLMGGASFSPLSIGWHTAFWAEGPEFVALALADGAAVGTWPDEASTHDATQATAGKKPIYRAAAAAFNSRAAIEGADDDNLASAAFTLVAQPVTIVVVGRFAGSNSQYLFEGGGTIRTVIYRVGSTNWRFYSGADVSAGSADTNAHLFVVTFNGASSSFVVDGATLSTENPGTNGPNLWTMFNAAGLTAYGGARLAFAAAFAGSLTAQNKADLLAWSRAHYGTP